MSAALDHGVPVALGSDWSPSGSKNLLGELKVAQLAAQAFGIGLSSADLVTMVTTAPARLLGWQRHLGSIEPGKRADLIVVAGASGDSYDQLVRATESDIDLVMINGVPRAGTASLMSALGLGMGERLTVGGRQRVLNLAQATADPLVEALSAADAISRLEHALAALGTTRATLPALAAPPRRHVWLAVDGLIDNHMSPRPHLMYRGRVTGPNFRGHVSTRPANRPTGPLPALTLDPLTAVDNPAFYDAINAERNVPSAIRQGLVALKPK